MAGAMTEIVVNLGTNVTVSAAAPLIRKILGAKVVQNVEPLFPGDTDPTVSGLYTVVLTPAMSPDEAIATLEKVDQVEYAHAPAVRKGM